MNYKSGWLTINRSCNIRCKWCYAKDTNYKVKDDMDLDLAYKLIDLFKDLKIKSICILGGEPTLYKDLTKIIKYCYSRNIKTTLITNGIKLSDNNYLQSLIDAGITSITISLKAENAKVYNDITGVDCFDKVLKGINNCSKKKIPLNVSMVLTEENIKTFTEGVKHAFDAGSKRVHLSFCYEFNTNNEYSNFLNINNPKHIIKEFMNSYNELDKVSKHHFNLFQTFPLCLWDKKFIKMLEEKNQITSVCQLQRKNGLLFDTKGNIIPCNAMYKIKIGRYGIDFNDSKSLIEYVNKDNIVNAYKVFCGLPSEKCLKCKDVKNCAGGCVCQWTNYTFDQLMKKE